MGSQPVLKKLGDKMASMLKEVFNPDRFKNLVSGIKQEYLRSTSDTVKIVDAFILFSMLTGMSQMLYMIMSGTTFPFNSFLAGFLSCVGFFTLLMSLRIQITNPTQFRISEERAFADFVMLNVVLHFVVLSYMG